MSLSHQAGRLDLQVFAAEAKPLAGRTLLQNMERLAHESIGLEADSVVEWQAFGVLRERADAESEVWLQLRAKTSVPLTCQRCMTAVDTPLNIDRWYRFVATEAIAMAEDDEAEEDLLVMEPQFDLLHLLEDELLMALPVVPMHEQCPLEPGMTIASLDAAGDSGHKGSEGGDEKKNPFAVLAQLKKNNEGT